VYLTTIAGEHDANGGESTGGETWFPFVPSAESSASPHARDLDLHRIGGSGSNARATLEGALAAANRIATKSPPTSTSSERDRRGLGGSEAAATERAAETSEPVPVPGLKVAPRRGRAVLFYNLELDSDDPDPAAIHAALPLRKGGRTEEAQEENAGNKDDGAANRSADAAARGALGESTAAQLKGEKWIANFWVG
jgi:hypothetical protein